MRPSIRFLAVAVIGWAGVRAASLGVIPGADMFKSEPATAQPLMATQFPQIEPIAPAPMEAPPPYQQAAMPYAGYPPQMIAPPRPIVIPIDYVYRTTPPPQSSNQAVWSLPEPRKQLYFPTDRPDDWQISRLAATGIPAQSRVTEPMQSTAPSVIAHRLDRIQLAMWAMLRRPQDAVGSPTSLAAGPLEEARPEPGCSTISHPRSRRCCDQAPTWVGAAASSPSVCGCVLCVRSRCG